MRKTLLLLASAALLLVGCAKEQVGPAAGDGEMVEVDITAGTAELTKAAIDKDGQAAYVTRWIMEVRDGSGAVYSRKVATEAAGTLQHKFNIKLFKNQQYTFAFWADNGGEFYDASDLSAVKYVDGKSVVAGADAKDAFSGVETLTFSQSISKTIVLHRPFAQLNVITKDLKDLRADAISAEAYNAFKPKNFKTTITVPTQFDVLTGEASVETELILAADDFYGKSPLSYEDAPKQATMFMAYIFASKDEKDIRTVNFKFDVDSQTGNNTFDFTDVPFQRNYRTNILGNFLSGDAEWTVQIDTVWSGEYDRDFVAEGSVAAANQALKEGKNSIEISAPEDYSTPVTMPAQADGKDISVKVTGVSGKTMTFKPADGAQGPANLYITTEAKDLVIDCPKTHVEVNGGAYTNVTATTSATTLVVGKDVTISKLVLEGGNAKVLGAVAEIVRNGNKVYWCADDKSSLIEFIGKAVAGDEVQLLSDIDLNNENWTPINIEKSITIDGKDHIIKNLKVDVSGTDNNAGLFGLIKGATVKNLTVSGAAISAGTGSAGTVVARIYPSGLVSDVKVLNSTLTGNHYIGGIVGTVYGSVKNCSAENVIITLTPNWDGEKYDNGDKGGGVIGFSQNDNTGAITGNSAKNVTVAGYRDIGGIVGAAGCANTEIKSNTVDGAKLSADQTINSYGEIDCNVNPIVGRILSGKLDASNTFANVEIKTIGNAAEKALSQAKDGETVTLKTADATKNVNIPVDLAKGVTIASDATDKSEVSKFEIPAGAKIEDLTIKDFEPALQAGADKPFVHVPADASFTMSVKDVKAAGDGVKNNWNTLVRVESCDNAELASEIVIDGVEIDRAKYLIYAPGGSRAISLTIKNCTIKNLTSWMAMANGSQFKNVTIDNCTIENCSGIVKFVMDSFTFTNNTLIGDNKEDHSASKKCIDYRGSNPTMTVSGNTSNGVNCDEAILAKTF